MYSAAHYSHALRMRRPKSCVRSAAAPRVSCSRLGALDREQGAQAVLVLARAVQRREVLLAPAPRRDDAHLRVRLSQQPRASS